MRTNNPAVFISYSHDSDEHATRVLALALKLRADGIPVSIDRDVNGTPKEGWPRWSANQVDGAEFILVVCTEAYARRFAGKEQAGVGRGADFEGALIMQRVYDEPRDAWRVVPLVGTAADEPFIPTALRRFSYHSLETDYDRLVAFLRHGAAVAPATIPESPNRRRATFHWSGRPAPVDAFVGRARELNALEGALLRSTAPIAVVSAVGGQGKTTLVSEWLGSYEQARHHEFARACYVSAYRFGIEFVAFLEFAVDSLGGRTPPNATVAHLARCLIEELERHPTLLVIDGLERWLRGAHGAVESSAAWTATARGEHESAAGLGDLLHAISRLQNGSKLLITTRALPASLDAVSSSAIVHAGTAVDGSLPGLQEREGLVLLRRLGVAGSDEDKRRCVRELGGHPLSLRVLAGILQRLGEPVERRRSIYADVATADDKLQAILRQAEALCGGEARILHAAALAPDDAPLDAVVHAVEAPGGAARTKLTIGRLAEWGLLAVAGSGRDRIQLHPLVRAHFAAAAADPREIHARLADYFEHVPISATARSLHRVAPRIWAVEHAAAAGDHARAVRFLIDTPLGGDLTLSKWFQTYGHSAFELEWTRKLALAAPAHERRVLLNSMVIAATRCGLTDMAAALVQEALAIEEDDHVA